MKVNTEEWRDRQGRYPAFRVRGKDANPRDIYERLYYHNGSGYKYAIVFDCMPDEYGELQKETPVYFLDDLVEEVLEYIDFDTGKYVDEERVLERIGEEKVRKWLEKQKH